ncbi:Mpo1 family 2-hydroxy fatty acid dioxygenase [Sphingomonas sp. GB1N7]|uniref:Mpo1 family 2-hydroxy fatty acid dioxygenase n=1 Tax=Parasphingomonas caseinilytica TaxID=3096158 RepID=UPI002FCA0264
MTPLVESLAKYAAYHRDRRNILTHMVGIPLIVLAVVILLSRPAFELFGLSLSPAAAAAGAAALFYLRLDVRFGVVMAILLGLCVLLGNFVAGHSTLAWLSASVSLFVVGWALQFLGHFYERRKPAFIDDVIGLIIGPLFVVAEIAFSLGFRDEVRAEVARSATRRNTL